MKKIALAAAIVCLTLAGLSYEMKRGRGTCPRCKGSVQGVAPAGLIASQALDRDLCVRYVGDQPYLYEVWSCGSCGFSAFGQDFAASLFPSALDYSALQLLKPTAKVPLTVLQRFLNAYTYYRASGKDPFSLATLLHHGAWAHRLSEVSLDVPGKMDILKRVATNPPPGMTEAMMYRLAADEIPADSPPGPRLLLRLEWLRRSGAALEVAERLEARGGDFGADLREPAETIRSLAEAETTLLRIALAEYGKSDRAGTPPAQLLTSRYLLGELNRRLGHPDEARKHLVRVIEWKEASPEMVQWAREQLDLLPPAPREPGRK